MKELGITTILELKFEGRRNESWELMPEAQTFYAGVKEVEIKRCKNDGYYSRSHNEYDEGFIGDKWHNRFFKVKGIYYYFWASNSTLLVTPKLITIGKYRQLCKLKNEELEAEREKRRKTIKTPIDVLRNIFDQHKMGFRRHSGGFLIECNWFELKFSPIDNSTFVKVEVQYTSGGGRSSYVHLEDVCQIEMASPNFEKDMFDIIYNFQNAIPILLGNKERRK
jgi:hypothetical protein